MLDSNQGVEPQTETVWRQGDKYKVPRIVFANKMDKIGADFFQCLKDIVDRLGAQADRDPAADRRREQLQGPHRSRPHEGASSGTTRRSAPSITTIEIPADMLDQAKEYREKMVEAAVELDDDAHGRLSRRQGAGRGDDQAPDPQGRASPARSIPVLCGSAFKNKGVQPLLDAVVDYLPSPLDVPAIKGIDPKTATRSMRMPDDNEPLSLLAFKIMDDPFVGTHHVLPHLFGHARPAAPASSTRPRSARSASAACC